MGEWAGARRGWGAVWSECLESQVHADAKAALPPIGKHTAAPIPTIAPRGLQDAPAGAVPSYISSDSDSELLHDHASKQELFAKQEQAKPAAKPQPATAALAAAAKAAKATAAKAAAEAAAERSNGKGKVAAAPGSGSKAAAAAVARAAAAARAATAEESEGSETEAEEEPQPRQLAKKRAGAAAPKGAAAKKAAAGKPGPSKAAAKPAAAGGRRPARAAAVTASAKLAKGDEEGSGSESEDEPAPQRQPMLRRGKAVAEEREEAGGGDSFVFRPPPAEVRVGMISCSGSTQYGALCRGLHAGCPVQLGSKGPCSVTCSSSSSDVHLRMPPQPFLQAKKQVGAAPKRRSPAKVGGPIKSPLKRMQSGKKRDRQAAAAVAAAAAAAELQVGLGDGLVRLMLGSH